MSSDLWSFSLATYARPGVEPACLQLQTAGANVCLLLCGLWLEQRGTACDEQRVEQLKELVGPWDREVVQPLRALRTQWKTLAEDDPVLKGLREQMKALELEANGTCCGNWNRLRRTGRAMTPQRRGNGWRV